MKINRSLLLHILCLLVAGISLNAGAQGTLFTYQGRLIDSNNPANGSYDMTFGLYSAASGGTQYGSTITSLAVPVSNGVFTVSLDFGNVYDGTSRYLQIGVRTNGASTYTNLPGQLLASAPYSTFAYNAITNSSTGVTLAGTFSGTLSGNGAGVTNVNTANLTGGAISASLLPPGLVTNNSSGVALTGSFSGSGSGLTNVWLTGGNNVGAGQFLGSTNNLTLDLRANNSSGLRITPQIGTNVSVAIGPGSTATGSNSVALGWNTSATGQAAVAMGWNTTASGTACTAMGSFLSASGDFSTAMGNNTVASGYASTASGQTSIAGGKYSFAAGYQAQATNEGSFVWADDSAGIITSTNNFSVTFRATGGYRLFTGASGAYLAPNATAWTSLSDRNSKKNFAPVDENAVLDKLAHVPVEQWNYKWESDQSTPNIGPMAQDFKHAFYPGRDDKGISTLEFDGVELAAIQALNKKLHDAETALKEKDAQISSLEKRMELLEKAVSGNAKSNNTK